VEPGPPDPDKLARDEEKVREGFWPKLRRHAAKLPFVEDLLAAYYCAMDTATPGYVRGILLGALAYFILPLDVVPDVIAGLGYTDDASVLAAALAAVRGHFKPEHREKARRALTDGLASPPPPA